MVEIAKDIGVGIASGLGQEGVKLAVKRMLAWKANPKDPSAHDTCLRKSFL